MEDEKFCKLLVDKRLNDIYEDTQCSECNIYIGGKDNFRKKIATMVEYKVSRKNREKPFFLESIRQHLIDNHNAIVCDEQEAEDAVGIAAYKYDNFDEFIIGNIDKDVDQISGNHYNYVTKKKYFVDKYQALRFFYTQLVTGDGTDDILGLYKMLQLKGREEAAREFRYSRYKKKLIGELNAVSTELEMFEIVMNVYFKWFGEFPRSEVLEIARLLWIRRYENEMWEFPVNRDFNYIDLDEREVIK